MIFNKILNNGIGREFVVTVSDDNRAGIATRTDYDPPNDLLINVAMSKDQLKEFIFILFEAWEKTK